MLHGTGSRSRTVAVRLRVLLARSAFIVSSRGRSISWPAPSRLPPMVGLFSGVVVLVGVCCYRHATTASLVTASPQVVSLNPSPPVRSRKDLPGRSLPLAGADEHLGDLHGIERRAFPKLIAADEEVESRSLGLR
jgi:hypothetical protein